MSLPFSNSIFVIDSHTGGEPTRIVVGGLPKIPGDSMAEKYSYAESKLDSVRNLLCNEPRGHVGMFGALLTEPCVAEADFGVLYFGTVGWAPMCGHGTIGVGTVLVETGMVPAEKSPAEIVLDTPAGIVRVRVKVVAGKAESVSLVNVPAFLYEKDVSINVPGYGEVRGDIGFGGNWFFYVDAETIGVRVRSEKIDDLIEAGTAIKTAINKEVHLVHPTLSSVPDKVRCVSLIDTPVKNKNANQKNIVVEGKFFDRSPCGTGTCARMAVLFGRNKLGLNEHFENESITGSLFRGRLIEETKVGDYSAVVPEITGSAYITGFNHIVLDQTDPFPEGFLVGEKIV